MYMIVLALAVAILSWIRLSVQCRDFILRILTSTVILCSLRNVCLTGSSSIFPANTARGEASNQSPRFIRWHSDGPTRLEGAGGGGRALRRLRGGRGRHIRLKSPAQWDCSCWMHRDDYWERSMYALFLQREESFVVLYNWENFKGENFHGSVGRDHFAKKTITEC